MGLQDRDYWKERYDENLGAKKEKRLKGLSRLKFFKASSNRGTAYEFSFVGKLAITIFVLLGSAIVYRYFR